MDRGSKKLKELDAVRKLVEQGLGRVAISRILGISGSKATRLIKKIRDNFDHIPNTKTVKALKQAEALASGSWSEQDSKQRFETVKDLMDSGLGRNRIAEALGVPSSTAEYWIEKVRQNLVKANIADKVCDMLEDSADAYEIAKRLNRSVPGAVSLIKKVEGLYSPADDWIKKAASKGILLSKMQEVLKVKDKDRAREILQTSFPGCFVVELKEDNDTRLVPVHDSKNEIEYLKIDTSKKPFTYYVSPAKNYMLIKVDDNYGENELILPVLSDIHVGASAHRADLFANLVNWIGTSPGSIPLLLGDAIENSSKSSVGLLSEQYSTPNEQVVEFCKRVESIAHLLPFSLSGNHEERTERFSDFNVGMVIADLLKVPHFRNYVVMDIHWRGTVTRVYSVHRYSKSSYSIAQVDQAVMKVRQNINYHVDFWTSGHNHNSFILPKESIELSAGRGFEHTRWFILNNGSCVGRTGNYAEHFPPSPQDLVYGVINEDGTKEAKSIPILGI